MKIFKNNLCYVNYGDLARYQLPTYLQLEKLAYNSDEFLVFSDQKSINYIKNRLDIIDYNDVCNLDDKELDAMINLAYQNWQDYINNWKKIPNFQNSLYTNIGFLNSFKMYEDIYYGLLEYKKERERIDNNIRHQISELVITKKIK